jgi:hypothetical protein
VAGSQASDTHYYRKLFLAAKGERWTSKPCGDSDTVAGSGGLVVYFGQFSFVEADRAEWLSQSCSTTFSKEL